MKSVLLIALTISSIGIFAGIKSELVPMYQVISDSIDRDIPSGKCLITGVITRNGEFINEALIYSTNGTKVNSNKIGKFKILVDTADTYLVIHKSSFKDAFVEGLKFKNKHHIVLKVFMPMEEEMILMEKPVIYAYAPNPTNVNISLSCAEPFTFTYPKISAQNDWNLTTMANGNISQNNQEFPYLFWESETSNITYQEEEDFIHGNIVKNELVVSFLENQLTVLGLNDREKTDFITYWGPRMIQKKYALIQFIVDEDYERIASINVTPKPDAMRRVYLLFTPFDDYPSEYKIKTQVINPTEIDRSGLTIIEWGGSEVSQTKLNDQL